MRFKIILVICPLLLLIGTAFAKPVFDSVGVENQNGKKVILHKVEPKETYFAVGRRYNIKPNLIIQFNNNIVLQPGAVIKVPTDLPFASAPVAVKQAPKQVEEKQSIQQYKVSPGETLYAISRRFSTTVDKIKADNDLKSDALAPGQLLTIKTGSSNSAEKETPKQTVAETKPETKPVVTQPAVVQQPKPQLQTPVTQPQQTQVPVQTNTQPAQTAPVSLQNTQQYKVSAGETLYTIAKRFGTSVDDIVALNKIQNNVITPGEIIIVRSGMPPAPVAPKPQQTVVAKRDTTSVASSAGDSVNADRHIPANRYGLFLHEEKGPATWIEDASIDPNKKLVLHRTAPIGTVVKITNPMTNRTVLAKVVGRFNDNEANKDVILVVTKNVAETLGAMDKRFRVTISYGVPTNDQ